MKRDWFCRIGAIVFAGLLVAVWLLDPEWSTDAEAQLLWKSTVSRLLGSAVFLFVLLYLRYRIWRKPQWSGLAVWLPALAVVVNNLPILALLSGSARVDRSDLVWLFALDSLMIGLFEELAFRGVLFPVLLESRCQTQRGIRLTAVVSSAVFGLIHLVNLLEGAGFAPTVLQVGYSFLIGGMCTVVLLKTGNLIFCILLHAIYDFCGGLLPTLGSGSWWDIPTVIFTAVLAVAVTAWMLYLLFRITPEEAGRIFPNKKEKQEQIKGEET